MLALIYLIYILAATLYPFEFAAGSWVSFRQGLAGFFALSGHRDFILNVALFMPLGVLLYLMLIPARNRLSAMMFVAVIGGGASLFIEVMQVFFHRDPSAFDVLANMSGTATGAVVAALWSRRFAAAGGRWSERLEKSGAVLAMAILYGAIPLILSIVQYAAPFGVWNSNFTLQLGNEATLDRPWLGKIHFVALYNRALSSVEIVARHDRGPSSSALPDGVVSLYAFTEGEGHIVYDRSEVEPPLNLSFEPTNRIRWLDAGNGVEILRPAILTSREPARKLVAASRATQELSIEAWVTPRDAAQAGPARMVSLSENSRTRNFTVGQQGSAIEFRLRTPATGWNGSPLALTSANGVHGSAMLHIVATYRNGVERLYINGGEQQPALDVARDSMIGLGTARTAAAAAAYGFFYFLPSAFLASGFFARRMRYMYGSTAVLAATVLAAGLMFAAELFQVVAFERAIDLRLIGFGILAAALGALGAHKHRRIV